jgi:hypothetical protein
LTEIEILIKDCLAFEASDRPASAAAVRERLVHTDRLDQRDDGSIVIKDRQAGIDKAADDDDQSDKIDLTIKIPEERIKVYREPDLTTS